MDLKDIANVNDKCAWNPDKFDFDKNTPDDIPESYAR